MVAYEKRNSAQLFCAVPTRNDLALSSLLFFRPTHTKVGIPNILPTQHDAVSVEREPGKVLCRLKNNDADAWTRPWI